MKKSVLAVAIICAATLLNAATCNWKVTCGNLYDSTAKSVKYSGTAYVFDAGVLAQSALFDAFSKDASYKFADNAAGSVTLASGSVSTSANTFVYGDVGSNYDFYMVVVEGKNIYFSNMLENKAGQNPPNVGSLGYGAQNNGSTTFSNTAPAAGFQGAGHWSLASVPEPTSGLMMLIGVGLMALKRKRV